MFGPKLFDNTISPSCSYCEHGCRTSDGAAILCEKRGVVGTDFYCRKFLYDPLKREPKRRPRLPDYQASDFEL